MKSVYKRFSRAILNNTTEKFQVHGRFITVLENSSATDLEFSIGEQAFEVLPKGLSVELSEGDFFGDIQIKNTSGATATVTFAISAGRIFDSRVVLSGSLAVNSTPDSLSTPAPAAVTDTPGIAVAADSTTREVVLQNNGASDVWVGASTVDAATFRGYKIAPGAGFTWNSSAALYAVCGSGLTSTLSVNRNYKA